ncbi:hypothetical protein Xszus_01643 [Xenorhabdus szentirmaii]|nr:hypothetical protein Xszus_01643 [Xenorhabdus szentirmaii]
MQATVNDENKNAHAPLSKRVASIVNKGRKTPNAGIAHRIG